jgi:hypothetical protein
LVDFATFCKKIEVWGAGSFIMKTNSWFAFHKIVTMNFQTISIGGVPIARARWLPGP